jgi:hypothetical protein
MKEIVLGNSGYSALVDDQDYDYLNKWKWQYHKAGYAQRATNTGGKYVCLLLHRVLMNPPEGMVIDHINHNKLDNMRNNLRVCTPSQNGMNRNGKNLYKGVSWNKRACKWQVKITVDKRLKHIGEYKDIIEAADAYNRAAKLYYGEFAALNEI